MKQSLLLIVVGLLLCASFLITGYHFGLKYAEPTEVPTEKVDTLFIHDTLISTKPIYVDRVKLDSILVPADTVRLRDTLYVYLQREQVVWQDSLSRVYASGVQPQVDSVLYFTTNTIIIKEVKVPVVKKTHWGLGVNVGYGLGVNNKQVVGIPYIGVGVSYNILSW